MSEERTEVDPERVEQVTEEKRISDALGDVQAKLGEQAVDGVLDMLRGGLSKLTARKTPQQERVAEVLEEQTTQRVPALSAGRVQLASLSDARYRALPEPFRFRNADDDYTCQRWLVALKRKDETVLREMAAADRNQRLSLATGDSDAAGAVFDGSGGQLLPLPLANYLLNVLYRNARMRQYARIFQAGAGASLRIPIQSLSSVTAWVAEGITYGDGTGAPNASSSVNLQLQKLTNISDVTDEMLEDSAFNVGQWLTSDVGMNMAAEEDIAMYSTGVGAASDEPIGLEASITTTATTPAAFYVPVATDQEPANDFTSVATLTAAHLTKMYFALPESERRDAIWSAGDQVAQVLSNLVDTNGRPILNFANNPLGVVGDADTPGQVGTIFGRPFVNLPGNNAGTPAVPTQDENRLYFGNMMRTYAILEKSGIRAKASEDFKFNVDVTTFKFTRRVDGQPIGNLVAAVPVQYVYTGSIIA